MVSHLYSKTTRALTLKSDNFSLNLDNMVRFRKMFNGKIYERLPIFLHLQNLFFNTTVESNLKLYVGVITKLNFLQN